VRVLRFADHYDLLSALVERSPTELQRRDLQRNQELQRWLALDAGQPVGAVTAFQRPDERTFLQFICREAGAYEPLAEAATTELGRPLHTVVDESNQEILEVLIEAGFATELTMERFEVPFDPALRILQRAWTPAAYRMHPADSVDRDALFELDNAIRGLVPGTDGWRGDRAMFEDELAEAPPFDPAAYLVAIHEPTGAYAGLVRIWRNPAGPRLGLIGVLPEHRGVPIAAALLRHALEAAADWGYDAFLTETSPENQSTYPLMRRLGAESRGRFHQLVRQ